MSVRDGTERARVGPGLGPGLAPGRPVEVSGPASIRTARLVLRPLVESDRDEFHRVILESRTHLSRFSTLHLPGESDGELFERQLQLTAEGDRTGRACRRVAVASPGRIVGSFNLNAVRRGLAWEADANWWLAPSAVGFGFATEALCGLLAHGFADLPGGLGLHRVLAGIQKENAASLRLAGRVGFRRSGPERSYLHAGGKWDLHEMFEVSPEWFERARGAAAGSGDGSGAGSAAGLGGA